MKEEISHHDKLEKYKKESELQQEKRTLDLVKNSMLNKRDLARLLDYYRMVIDAYEKERVNNLNLLESIKVSNELIHKVDWEKKRRQDELLELKQALYESNISLNNERKKCIHYSKMIENCQTIAKEDKRRIAQLLQLAEPIEQTIKLYKDHKPEITEKYSNFNFEDGAQAENFTPDPNSVSLKKNFPKKKECCKNKGQTNKVINIYDKKESNKNNLKITPSDEKQQIIRTVMFPTQPELQDLSNENQNLKKEIEDLKQDYENRIAKLEESRKIKEEDFRQQVLNYKKQSDDLLKANQKLEKVNYSVCRDMFELRLDNGKGEKKIYEDMEVIKNKNQQLENELKTVIKNANKEKALNLHEFNKKTREMTTCLRGQVRAQEETANIIKEQYKQIQKLYNNKVKDLTENIKKLGEECELLQNRKNFQIEGYINEIILMRKRIKSYQDFAIKMNEYSKQQFDFKRREDNQKPNQNINIQNNDHQNYEGNRSNYDYNGEEMEGNNRSGNFNNNFEGEEEQNHISDGNEEMMAE
jgi:coiled-coil domain-containing protein 77